MKNYRQAVVKLEFIRNLTDIANGFMALPNLVAPLGLSGVVITLTRNYNKNLAISYDLHKIL